MKHTGGLWVLSSDHLTSFLDLKMKMLLQIYNFITNVLKLLICFCLSSFFMSLICNI